MSLEVGPLDWAAVSHLAATMREGDVRECAANGKRPIDAIVSGLLLGPSFGVFRPGGECVGAFGCCPQLSTIWSLWASPLQWYESLNILRETPLWVRQLVSIAGRDLHNYVDIRNKSALEWLHRSGMFSIDETIDQINGQSFLHFSTDGVHV